MKLNRRFFKKFFLITGGLLLALFAILAIIYTVLNIKWSRELRCELEKIKASGAPMTIKDITPAPLVSSENASVEYLQIFSLMTDGTFSMKISRDVKDNTDLKELGELCFSSKTMGEFEDQCRKNSVSIREIFDKDTFKQIFELCEKAATKPGMNFNLNYEEGLAMRLPHLPKMRDIVRLLRVKAEMEILAGERGKAWETILTALKLSSHLKNELDMISSLIYIACNNICFDFISYNLPRYGISYEQEGKLMSELAPEKTVYAQSVNKAIDGERICQGGWVFERMLVVGRSNFAKYDFAKYESMSYSARIGARWAANPCIKKDYLEYLKIMECFKAEYDQPYYKLAAKIDEGKMLAGLPKYCVVTKMLCPALAALRLKTAEIETRSQEIRLRLALEEYKNLKGAYPDKLEQLSPQILTEIPISEVTGLPFEYSKDKDSYKISGGIAEKK